jgi:acyl-CoA synthetase (AMP-forming)/AMP-acid ligase II
MMRGYLNREDATHEMLWRDGEGKLFFRSGDVGRIDEEGFIYLLDRKKDVIISGGLNIYATDLEMVLDRHEAVHESAVIGIPSNEWGETPLALVVLEPGARSSAEELREWANARLGKSHRVARVELRGDLPKSDIGKVLKRQLREPYWKGTSRKI